MVELTIRGTGTQSRYRATFNGPITGERKTERTDTSESGMESTAFGYVDDDEDIWEGPLPIAVENIHNPFGEDANIEAVVGDNTRTVEPGDTVIFTEEPATPSLDITMEDVNTDVNRVDVTWKAVNPSSIRHFASFDILAGGKSRTVSIDVRPSGTKTGTEVFHFDFGLPTEIQVCVDTDCDTVMVEGGGVSTQGDCDVILVKEKPSPPENGGGQDPPEDGNEILDFITSAEGIATMGVLGLGIGLARGDRNG